MIQKRFQIVYAGKCVLNNFTVVMSNVKNYDRFSCVFQIIVKKDLLVRITSL